MASVVRYRANPVSAARRYWSLYRGRRFSPDEIHYCQLLDPALTPEELRQFVSKEELLSVQNRLNPPKVQALTEDKLLFHAHCMKAGLPVPQLYGAYDANRDDPSQLERILGALPADRCILKPVHGLNGAGVARLRKVAGGWDDGEAILAPREIALRLRASAFDRWMLQELLRAHPALCSLSDVEGVQTVRAITVVHLDGRVEILAALFKVLCHDAAYDNFGYGRTGNLIAYLDLQGGFIESAAGRSAQGRYAATRHPRTGKALIGFPVPGWDDVLRLAAESAKAFMPLRTLGWDIAVTPRGPYLIEGNASWDPPSGSPRLGDIYRSLRALAKGPYPMPPQRRST